MEDDEGLLARDHLSFEHVTVLEIIQAHLPKNRCARPNSWPVPPLH